MLLTKLRRNTDNRYVTTQGFYWESITKLQQPEFKTFTKLQQPTRDMQGGILESNPIINPTLSHQGEMGRFGKGGHY